MPKSLPERYTGISRARMSCFCLVQGRIWVPRQYDFKLRSRLGGSGENLISDEEIEASVAAIGYFIDYIYQHLDAFKLMFYVLRVRSIPM